jgi:hypothetical protein
VDIGTGCTLFEMILCVQDEFASSHLVTRCNASSHAQNRMIALPRRIFERSRDIAGFEQRTIRQDFFPRRAGGQQIKHIPHADPQAAQAGSAAALAGINGDPVGFAHPGLPGEVWRSLQDNISG